LSWIGLLIMRLVASALAGRDITLQPQGARPIEMHADQRRLIAPTPGYRTTPAAWLCGRGKGRERSGSTLTIRCDGHARIALMRGDAACGTTSLDEHVDPVQPSVIGIIGERASCCVETRCPSDAAAYCSAASGGSPRCSFARAT